MASTLSASGRGGGLGSSADALLYVFGDCLWKYEKKNLTPGEARSKQALWDFYVTLDYAARKKVCLAFIALWTSRIHASTAYRKVDSRYTTRVALVLAITLADIHHNG